jgi:protein O-GlcNAc transferase
MKPERILLRPVLLLISLALLTTARIDTLRAQSAAPTESAGNETAEQHLGRGYDALKRDRYEVAVAEFRAALAIDPKLVLRARFPLAVALFELHKSDEARREFESLGREIPDHPNVLYYLGRLDLEAGNFPSAIGNFTKAVQNPPFPDTAYYLGYAYFKQGDLPNAEKWLTQAVQANPQDARMRYQLALVFRKEGREEEAKAALALSEELRQRDADQSKLRLECKQKLEQGPRAEAHAVCDRLYDPENAENLTELGTIYAQHGDLEAALEPLRRAAELAPQSPQMQFNLGLAYYQLHEFEQARAPLENAVKRWPDLFQLSALYGAVLFELHEDLAAYQELRHAHQLKAEDSGTGDLLYLATLRVAQKNQAERHYSDALRYFEQAAKQKPIEPEPHRSMAEIYKLTGRPTQAAAERQKAEVLAKSAVVPK